MYASTSAVFSVNNRSRCITSQKASKERHRFIVGSCALYESNEITVLEYYENTNTIKESSTYSHKDQIWSLESSPKDPSLIVNSHQSISGDKAVTLYCMTGQDHIDTSIEADDDTNESSSSHDHNKKDLQVIHCIDSSNTYIHSVKWHPKTDTIALASSKTVSVYTIGNDTSKIKETNRVTLREGVDIQSYSHGSIAFDPHTQSTLAATCNQSLHFIDTKSGDITSSIVNAHDGIIRDIDYNPNRQQMIISTGDDRKIKFWDIRNPIKPVKTLLGHSHYVWCARYNPFHDQLVVSGASDNVVNLWRIASCSSSPWIGTDNSISVSNSIGHSSNSELFAEKGSSAIDDDPPDVKVRSIDQHEDSVYGVAWSSADAWMFASLSYDGRITINHVPSTEKYKILL